MFSGYLIKIGEDVFPMRYINEKTYNASVKQRLDLDSYRDANGVLHREVSAHSPTKIELTTIDLTNKTLAEIIRIFQENFINEAERKVLVTYYDVEKDGYDTGEFYISNTRYEIEEIVNGEVRYKPVRFAFTEY